MTNNLNPQQFMTTREIVGAYRPNDRLPKDSTDEGVWARKLGDTKANDKRGDMVLSLEPLKLGTLHDHIAARGVQNAVTLITNPDSVHPSDRAMGIRGSVFDGHHRIAAMHDIDPDVPIPVQHATSKDHARMLLNRGGARAWGNRGR